MTQPEPIEPEVFVPVRLTYRTASPEKTARVNLGIALLHALREPGKRCTVEEIAAWSDCSVQAVQQIEKAALEKLRRALRKAGVGREILRSFVPDHSRYAVARLRVESV
jgi:hypothetical protein